MKTTTKVLMAAAFAGALLARPVLANDQNTGDKGTNGPSEKASCKGKAGCKGKDGCKSKDGCKGKDSCKGKNGCSGKDGCKGKSGSTNQ